MEGDVIVIIILIRTIIDFSPLAGILVGSKNVPTRCTVSGFQVSIGLPESILVRGFCSLECVDRRVQAPHILIEDGSVEVKSIIQTVIYFCLRRQGAGAISKTTCLHTR